MTIGEKILELRTRNGLSQGELAQQLHISRQSISKWETGQSIPDVDNIVKVSKVFNVTVDYLLNYKVNPEDGEYNQADEKEDNDINILNKEIEEQSKNIKNKGKTYYYNEIQTKIISYITLIIFLPLNVYLYNKGIYGEVFIELGFFGKEFFKSLLYDIPFIIVTVGLLIKFIKDLKDPDRRMVIINKKDSIIGYLCSIIISTILIFVYFKAPEFSSIAMFIGSFGIVYISTFEVIRELTKK